MRQQTEEAHLRTPRIAERRLLPDLEAAAVPKELDPLLQMLVLHSIRRACLDAWILRCFCWLSQIDGVAHSYNLLRGWKAVNQKPRRV